MAGDVVDEDDDDDVVRFQGRSGHKNTEKRVIIVFQIHLHEEPDQGERLIVRQSSTAT